MPGRPGASGRSSGRSRTVYDGDQVLTRSACRATTRCRRAPWSATRGGVATYYAEFENALFGRTGYTHGATLDRPLEVLRIGYSTKFPGTVAIVPYLNLRNAYDLGSFVNGTDGAGSEWLCTSYVGSLPSDTTCLHVVWPAPYFGAWLQDQSVQALAPFSWIGSLVTDRRDGSNQLYRRNRYFDPQTQTFTQEDPIGLAGGLNAYGFASGDPVNFDDPFGLCPVTVEDPTPCPNAGPGTASGALRIAQQIAGMHLGAATAEFAAAGVVGAAAAVADAAIAGEAVGEAAAAEEVAGSAAEGAGALEPSEGMMHHFARQLQEHGRPSVEKAIRTLSKRIDEHLGKLADIRAKGGNSGSVEDELSNFRRQIEAAQRTLNPPQ